MQKSLMALTTSPKSIIVGADNQFNDHVFNYTHNQNYKTKISFVFILTLWFVFLVVRIMVQT